MVLIDMRGNHPHFFVVEQKREKLQKIFAPHFEGLNIIPRERVHRLPAIVEDFEKGKVNVTHIKKLTQNDPLYPYQDWARDCVQEVLNYVSGYCLPDGLPNHEARRDVKKRLPVKLYNMHRTVNQLSGNRIYACANSFRTLFKCVDDIDLSYKLSALSKQMLQTVNRNGHWDNDSVSLNEKVRKVRCFIDLAFEGLELLSVGLPPKDDVVFVT